MFGFLQPSVDKDEWFVLFLRWAQTHLELFHPLPVSLCLSLPQCLSVTYMELAAEEGSQETRGMKGGRSTGSLDELVAMQCQAAEAHL